MSHEIRMSYGSRLTSHEEYTSQPIHLLVFRLENRCRMVAHARCREFESTYVRGPMSLDISITLNYVSASSRYSYSGKAATAADVLYPSLNQLAS